MMRGSKSTIRSNRDWKTPLVPVVVPAPRPDEDQPGSECQLPTANQGLNIDHTGAERGQV